jgi:hypothetical protein
MKIKIYKNVFKGKDRLILRVSGRLSSVKAALAERGAGFRPWGAR